MVLKQKFLPGFNGLIKNNSAGRSELKDINTNVKKKVNEISFDELSEDQKYYSDLWDSYLRPIYNINIFQKDFELSDFKMNNKKQITKITFINKYGTKKIININSYKIEEEKSFNDDNDATNYYVKNLVTKEVLEINQKIFVENVLLYFFRDNII